MLPDYLAIYEVGKLLHYYLFETLFQVVFDHRALLTLAFVAKVKVRQDYCAKITIPWNLRQLCSLVFLQCAHLFTLYLITLFGSRSVLVSYQLLQVPGVNMAAHHAKMGIGRCTRNKNYSVGTFVSRADHVLSKTESAFIQFY